MGNSFDSKDPSGGSGCFRNTIGPTQALPVPELRSGRKNEWGNKETPLEAGDRNQDATGTAFAIGFGKDKSQTQGRYSMISLGIGVWNSLPW